MQQKELLELIIQNREYLNRCVIPRNVGRRIIIDTHNRLRYSTEWGSVDLEDQKVEITGPEERAAHLRSVIRFTNQLLKYHAAVYGSLETRLDDLTWRLL